MHAAPALTACLQMSLAPIVTSSMIAPSWQRLQCGWHAQAAEGAQAVLAWDTYQQHVMSQLSDMQATVSPAIMEADYQRETRSHPLWQPLPSAILSQPQPIAPADEAANLPLEEFKNSIGPTADDVQTAADGAADSSAAERASSSLQQAEPVHNLQDAAVQRQEPDLTSRAVELSSEGSEDGEVDFEMEIDAGAGAALPHSSPPPVPEGGPQLQLALTLYLDSPLHSINEKKHLLTGMLYDNIGGSAWAATRGHGQATLCGGVQH